MEWKNQEFSHYCVQVSRMKSISRKDQARSTYRLFAVLLPCRVYRGALKPFDSKGLFCSGLAFFSLPTPKGCFVYFFLYFGGRQRSREGVCRVTAYK